MVQKNKPYGSLKVEGFDKHGQALVELEGNKYALDPRQVTPGDEVTIQILHHKKKQAKVISKELSSPQTQKAPCRHFGTCGGCSYQHLPYSVQLTIKAGMVQDILNETQLDLPPLSPIVACKKEWFYRNKMEYTFSPRSWLANKPSDQDPIERPNALGFFVPFSGNKVLDLDECHLQDEPATKIRNWIKSYARDMGLTYHNGNTHNGFLRTLLVRNTSIGENLVMVVFHPDGGLNQPQPSQKEETQALELLNALIIAVPEITSLYYTWNYKMNDSYTDLQPILNQGKPWLLELFDGIRFKVGPLSFMQVNPWQTPTLYNLIIEQANITNDDLVYDLYCGAGTISAYLAKQARHVIGIEYVEQAIDHAKEMAIDNGFTNLTFFAGDMKDLLNTEFIARHGSPDVVVVDPPRAGLHKDVVKVLNTLEARTLIYVSCKPESLGRDLMALTPHWKVEKITPFDLMPQTLHIETVVTLSRKRNP